MKLTVFLLALALPLTAVSRANADPVTITSGFLLTEGWGVVSRPSTVSGTDGFRMTTTLAVGPGSGRIDPLSFCFGETECAPGTRLNVGVYLDAFDGGLIDTRLTLNGREYDVNGVDASLLLRPDGLFTVPEFGGAGMVVVTAPFTLTGFFSDHILIQQTQITGRGTASITLTHPDRESPGWVGSSVRYDFASADPVPEPASMLLFGSGLAALAAVRRRRRGTSVS
jgi:PEP-CTERM motif-containing protein